LPEFLALKYKLMAANAFRFFRGTCHIFYEDLARVSDLPKSPPSWICGDLHLENFGSYKGDNRLVYFDLNDFDEAILAPVLWEIARMATSIMVGFDSLNVDAAEARDAAAFFLKTYSDTLASGKARYIEPETAKGIVWTFLETVANRKQKDLLKSRVTLKKGICRLIIDDIRLFKIDKDLKKHLLSFLNEWLGNNKKYKNGFKIHDVAFRMAGTGSVGVRRYAFLIEKTEEGKFLLLDMKEAVRSSIAPFTTVAQPSWNSEAERVVTVQHRMQNVSPAFLSSSLFDNRAYVLKELQPIADKINFDAIKNRLKDLKRVIQDMALLTASSQLRSSGRQQSAIADDLMAFGQSIDWQSRLLDYAMGYASQVKKDYEEFAAAYHMNYF
jgi:uncharacterized protein (DUF2252 family)